MTHKETAAAFAELEAFLASAKGEPRVILADYRERRRTLRASAMPHPPAAVALAGQLLGAEALSYTALRRALGPPVGAIPAAYDALCRRFAIQPHPRSASDFALPDPLAPFLVEALGPLPLTHSDPDLGAHMAAPTPRRAHRVMALTGPRVRLAAGLVLTLAAARRLCEGRQNALIASFRTLDVVLRGDAALASPAATCAALEAFLADETRSAHVRADAWTHWTAELARIDRYMESRSAIAARYASWRIALPVEQFARTARRLRARADAEREARRDRSCASLAGDLEAASRAFDAQFAWASALADAFDDRCARIDAGEIALDNGRARFSVHLAQAVSLADEVGSVRIDCAVVTVANLAARVPHVTERALAKAEGSPYLLEYLGPREPQGEPPILAMVAAGCFLKRDHATPAQQARRDELLPPSQWPQVHVAARLFTFADRQRVRLAWASFRAGVVLLPVHELQFAMAVGRAIHHLMCAGARTHEAMQIEAEPDFYVPCTHDGRTSWKFEVIAKGAREPSSYFLSERGFDAVFDVGRVAKANHWVHLRIPPTDCLKTKARPARFLFQRGGRQLRHVELSFAVGLPLWPLSTRAYDHRHAFARSLRHQGQPLSTVAAALHHRGGSARPTAVPPESAAVRGYARPTTAMQIEVAHRLGRRKGLRK